MGCSYNFHSYCRQDTTVFKRAQLRAGSNAVDLQTQIPCNWFRTSALAGREGGISPTFCFPLIYPGCVIPQSSLLLALVVLNRTDIYWGYNTVFSYMNSKGPISRQVLRRKCRIPQPPEAHSELSAPGSQEDRVQPSSSEAPPSKQCWTPPYRRK